MPGGGSGMFPSVPMKAAPESPQGAISPDLVRIRTLRPLGYELTVIISPIAVGLPVQISLYSAVQPVPPRRGVRIVSACSQIVPNLAISSNPRPKSV